MKRILNLIIAVIMIFNLIPCMGASAAMNIEIGEYVQMGTYYGQPILWRCVDIDENGPLMLSDKILCIKPFDASGTNTKGSHGRGYYSSSTQGYYRQIYGSNYWADSNMRCWLNSTASAGDVAWACGNPPDEDHVYNGYNEYDNESGFLSNFTQSERNAMKTVTQKSLLDGYEYSTGSSNKIDSNYHRYNSSISNVVQNYDTALAEQVTDTMFLLDVKQINEVYNNSSILGTNYYIGEPTAQCVENSEYKTSSLATGKKWYSWLRSPSAHYNGGYVRYVDGDGSVYVCSARNDSLGVRPAFYLNLSSSAISGGSGTVSLPYTIKGGSKGGYNQRQDYGDEISVTVMKNKKDMTESEDEYEEYEKISVSASSKKAYETEGYYKEEIDGAELLDGGKIYLEKSGMKVPILCGVILGGEDVRRNELVIRSGFTGVLSAEIDWNGQKEKTAYIDNGVTQIKLTDGKTPDDVNWGNFIYNSRGTYIVLKTVNGYTVKKKLNIKILADDNTPDEIDLNLFDSVTGIAGSIPYLDGLELSFDIPNFKLDFSVNPQDNSIKGVFGVDVAEWAYENNLRDKKDGKWEENDKQNAYKSITELIKDTAKEMEKNKKNQTTLAQDYKNLKKQLGKAHQKTTAKFGFDAGIDAVGYVEGKVDHDGFYVTDAGIIVTVSVAGSVSGEGVIWIIPYNWKLGGSAEANLNLHLIQQAIRAEKLTPQGNVAIKIGINAEGGPGLKKAHLNLGASGSLTPAWQFAPSSVFTLDANVGLYIEAVLGPWTWRDDLVDKDFRLYPSAKTASLMSIDNAYNMDMYSLRERKYSHIPSEFTANMEQPELMSYDTATRTDRTIKTNSYDVSVPQYTALDDGRALLVWVDDDTERAVINGTRLMYSVYDGENWSKEKCVEDDGSGDYSPVLKNTGDGVYLAWEDIDVQPEGASMEESLKDMDIKVAEFDSVNDGFINIVQLSDDSYMNCTPQLGVSDSGAVVSWITNTSGDAFGTGSTYGVDYAVISDGEVTEQGTAVRNVKSVDSHIAVADSGDTKVYYICDTDGDLSNVSDNVLISSQSGEYDSEDVSGLSCFEDTIYYYKNGVLASIGDSFIKDKNVGIANNNYCITNGGRTVLFTAHDGKAADIYAYFYDEESGQWGEAVRLTDLGCKITDVNGFADENGEIHLAFNKKNVAEDGSDTIYSTSDLAVLRILPDYNIAIKDAYTEKSNLIPGKEAVINIEVYNAGEKPVDVISVKIYDDGGNEVFTRDIDAGLLPGVLGEYEISYNLPEDFAPTEMTVEVSPKDEEDYNEADNSMAIVLDFNNLAITGINSTAAGGGYNINAVVLNSGFETEENIEISLIKDGETVDKTYIASLGSLEKRDVVFENVTPDTEYLVKITEKDNEEILVDNEAEIFVVPNGINTDTDGYIQELDYADGKITAEVSMFSAYEESMAYLTIYNSHGEVMGVASKPIGKGTDTVEMTIEKELSEGEYIVKLMLWDGNLMPFIKNDRRVLLIEN